MTDVMAILGKDPNFDAAMINIFGKFVGQYITTCIWRELSVANATDIQTAKRNESILTLGFDLDQFNRRRNRKDKLDEQEKQRLIKRILDIIHKQIDSYYEMNIIDLYRMKTHFYELKTRIKPYCKESGA